MRIHQPSFFDDEAKKLARRGDPSPSHSGAHNVLPRLSDLRAECLDIVRRHPGATCMEAATYEGMLDNRKLGRRLNELEKMGKVVRGGPRPCKITGRSAATWTVKEGE